MWRVFVSIRGKCKRDLSKRKTKKKTPTPGVHGRQGRSARPLHERRGLSRAALVLVENRPRGADNVLHRLPDLLVGGDLLRLLLLYREPGALPSGPAVVEHGVGVGAQTGPADAALEAAAVVVARAVPRGVTCSRTETKEKW